MTSIEKIFINDITQLDETLKELESKLSGVEKDLESKNKDLLNLVAELPKLEALLTQLEQPYYATRFTESEKQNLTESLDYLIKWSETSLDLLPSISEQQSKNETKLQNLESNTKDLESELAKLRQTLDNLKSNAITKNEAIELEDFLKNSLNDLEKFAKDLNQLESQLWRF